MDDFGVRAAKDGFVVVVKDSERGGKLTSAGLVDALQESVMAVGGQPERLISRDVVGPGAGQDANSQVFVYDQQALNARILDAGVGVNIGVVAQRRVLKVSVESVLELINQVAGGHA